MLTLTLLFNAFQGAAAANVQHSLYFSSYLEACKIYLVLCIDHTGNIEKPFVLRKLSARERTVIFFLFSQYCKIMFFL